MTMVVRMVRAAVPLVWFLCALGLTFAVLLHQAEWSQLTLAKYPNILLRAPQASGWLPGAILVSLVGGFRLSIAQRRSAIELWLTCLVMSGLLAVCCWMTLSYGYFVTPTEVIVRKGELGEPDRRIPLDGLVEVDQGCTISHGKSASYYPLLGLRFRSGEYIDLGGNAGSHELAKWTEAMWEVSQLPQFRSAQWTPNSAGPYGLGAVGANAAKCAQGLAGYLDGDDRAKLMALLGLR